MAKLTSIIKHDGTFNGITVVNSRLYGQHIRRKRGSVKPALLNESFQKSVSLTKDANRYAKAIKDPIDPFRKDFRDGSFWGRLVGLFRKQLQKSGKVDLSALEDFEFYRNMNFGTRFHAAATVSVSSKEQIIHVNLSSLCHGSVAKLNPSAYEQTLIIVFLGVDNKATTFSERVMLPLREKGRFEDMMKGIHITWERMEQTARWPIPPGSKTALLSVKCIPYSGAKPIGKMNVRAMRIVKVVGLG